MSLKISEHFFSVQGEGVSAGTPAYFIRLQNCNMCCGGTGGKWVKEGKASWWCDTETVWRQGKEYSNEDLIQEIPIDILQDILKGKIHIVWTGGEPMLQQEGIACFIERLRYQSMNFGECLYSEIETNGTVLSKDHFLFSDIQQINCSPKLANSGVKDSIRIKGEVIKQIKSHDNSWFKFVITSEDDIKEIQETYIKPFDIPQKKLILMPGVDKLSDLSDTTRLIMELSKKYRYKCCTRMHVLAWDKLTGV